MLRCGRQTKWHQGEISRIPQKVLMSTPWTQQQGITSIIGGPRIPSQYLLDSELGHEVGNDGCNPKPGNPRTPSDTAELVDDDISDGYRDSVVGGVMLLLQHVRHIRPRNTVYDGLTMAASNSCATFLASVLNEIVSLDAVDRLDMICLVYASICPSN